MTTPNHERMSSVDTAWLRMDSPGNSMMIVGVSATATPLPPAGFRRMIEQRFLCFTRFRHRPVADALGASWVEDLDFDLDAHLKLVVLPEPAGKAELEALAAELASTPLDPRRPMWQFHLVERYKGGSAWIMRVHHCYADGIAMIRVLLSMTEQDAGPALAARPRRRSKGAEGRAGVDVLPVLSWVEQLAQPAEDILENALAEGARLLESGVHQLFHPDRASALAMQAGGMVGEFARVLTLPDDPDTPLRGTLGGYKAVAWGEPIPLHEVKTVGRALGCTINDVIMSTVAGALGAYLREQDFDTSDLRVRASVPVNLRAAEEPLTLGNRFGLVFVEMALGLADPLRRLYAMSDTMAGLKGSMQPPMTLMVLGLMGMMPAVVQAPAIELFSRKATAVVSNARLGDVFLGATERHDRPWDQHPLLRRPRLFRDDLRPQAHHGAAGDRPAIRTGVREAAARSDRGGAGGAGIEEALSRPPGALFRGTRERFGEREKDAMREST